ncbi:MAG: hypothetical protein RML84_09315 [Anaerolineae bacterium]|nr:hypothetical protein [Anaerolineae bacterium]
MDLRDTLRQQLGDDAAELLAPILDRARDDALAALRDELLRAQERAAAARERAYRARRAAVAARLHALRMQAMADDAARAAAAPVRAAWWLAAIIVAGGCAVAALMVYLVERGIALVRCAM